MSLPPFSVYSRAQQPRAAGGPERKATIPAMAELFTAKYHVLWALLMAAALFFPVRQLIWVLSVRRAQRQAGRPADDARQRTLRRRAGFTAALISLVVGYLYTSTWWGA